jgi:ferredoxin
VTKSDGDKHRLLKSGEKMNKYVINRGCKLCDACYWNCPVQAIYIENDRAHINQEKCTGCGQCYDNCANEAISVIAESNDNQIKKEKLS